MKLTYIVELLAQQSQCTAEDQEKVPAALQRPQVAKALSQGLQMNKLHMNLVLMIIEILDFQRCKSKKRLMSL